MLEAWVVPIGLTVEPGAGEGAIIRAVDGYQEGGEPRPWLAIECRATARGKLEQTGAEVVIGDFLDAAPPSGNRDVAAVISNPPFHSAEEFIRQAARLYPNAERAFLVRLGFLASEGRCALWKDLGTPSVYVLPNRPSFTPDGKTDSADYCWIVFNQQKYADWPTFRVLASTPRELRRPK